MEANVGHVPTKFGLQPMHGWKVINPNKVFQVNFHIWPLTNLHDLWPQNILEANVGHLPTKFGHKQACGCKVIQVFCKRHGRTTEDRRTQFGSLSLPPPRWARQKLYFGSIICIYGKDEGCYLRYAESAIDSEIWSFHEIMFCLYLDLIKQNTWDHLYHHY